MSAVLEMPVLTPVSPKWQVVQERLDTVYDELFAGLQRHYRIADEYQVFAFLRQHSQLIPVLQEGRAVVSLFFGEKTPVLLKLLRDPEVGSDALIAWVLTDLPAPEAVERIAELDDTWFGERLEIVGELLDFNLGVP
jgi:hypothetical protein